MTAIGHLINSFNLKIRRDSVLRSLKHIFCVSLSNREVYKKPVVIHKYHGYRTGLRPPDCRSFVIFFFIFQLFTEKSGFI